MDEAVTTIYHEIYHHNSFAMYGIPGTEDLAEAYGRRMLDLFRSRVGG